MWFKTRIGLANVEGSWQYYAFREEHGKGVPRVSLVAYQAPADFQVKRLFRSSAKVHGPYMYLACFTDSSAADQNVAECMQIIEQAIRNGESICDLSNFGDDDAWHGRGNTLFIRWDK